MLDNQWIDDYLMGIEEIDNDHKKLFKIAQKAVVLMREKDNDANSRMFTIREMLTFLKNYFPAHAHREEVYMRQIGYDGYAYHKMLHDEFINIQLEKYQKIVESNECSKEEIWDFIGSGIGWLMEHVATADMAIVGKGVLSQPKQSCLNESAFEEEVNRMFTSTLNMEINAKIINTNYRGEHFGKAVHQKMILQVNSKERVVISGIEQSFLIAVAKMIYGDTVENEMDLILSTLQVFGANFWRTLAQRFLEPADELFVRESSIIVTGTLSEELNKMQPTNSILFTSDMGKFFVTTDAEFHL